MLLPPQNCLEGKDFRVLPRGNFPEYIPLLDVHAWQAWPGPRVSAGVENRPRGASRPGTLALASDEEAPESVAKAPKRRDAQLKAWAKMRRDDLAKAVAKALDGAGWLPELLITPVPTGALVVTHEGEAEAASIAAE